MDKWWIDTTTMEKLIISSIFGHEFDAKLPAEKAFLRAIAATDILYKNSSRSLNHRSYLFQMWFVLVERAIEKGYAFKNPKALAAATEYMFESSRSQKMSRKKRYAENYEITTSTLTKYINELIQFLPLFDA